jgi:glycine/D-amino acid oxidase-like deaminating enzyme
MRSAIDPSSIVGKLAAPQTKVDVLVVGAGSTGTAAATELARAGTIGDAGRRASGGCRADRP